MIGVQVGIFLMERIIKYMFRTKYERHFIFFQNLSSRYLHQHYLHLKNLNIFTTNMYKI